MLLAVQSVIAVAALAGALEMSKFTLIEYLSNAAIWILLRLPIQKTIIYLTNHGTIPSITGTETNY